MATLPPKTAGRRADGSITRHLNGSSRDCKNTNAIYHTTETNRTQTAAALMKWARLNEARFACCAKGIELADVYNGGAAFMAFLATEFGEGVHERILRSPARTFDEALASETRPSLAELLGRFRGWVVGRVR